MRTYHQGFSLIELMIVLAIIGILSAVAIPSFNDYITRTQAAEAVELVAGSKTALAEFFSDKGHWPSSAASVMTTTGGKYVSNIAITGGTAGTTGPIELTATMKDVGVNSVIQGGTVLFTSTDGSQWSCYSGGDKPVAYKYLRSCDG